MKTETIADRFDADHNEDAKVLAEASRMARLTIPHVLPEEVARGDTVPSGASWKPKNFQSVGSRGMTGLVGRVLVTLYPSDQPWFGLSLTPEVMYNPQITDEQKEAARTKLFLQELLVQGLLESAPSIVGGRPGQGFRSAKRRSITQLLVTGSTLEWITDDFAFKVPRRERYVTRRDDTGSALYHIVREKIDPLSLTEKQFVASGLDMDEIEKKGPVDRIVDITTKTEWQPVTKKWCLYQEVNGRVVHESDSKTCPMIATEHDLIGGEHYGRGYVSSIHSDLWTLDVLDRKLLDFATAASKMHPVFDRSSQVRDKDLAQESGRPIRNAVVQGGQVMDVAFLRVDKLNDFNVVYQLRTDKRSDLGKAMLMEVESAPRGEAGRSPVAWRTNSAELESSLGGLFTPLSESNQLPTVQRTMEMIAEKKIGAPMPKEFVRVDVLTGLAALSSQLRLSRLLTFSQIVNGLGPQAGQYLDAGVLLDVASRYMGIYEPGVIKSPEKRSQEQQEQIAAATQQAAAQKGVDVLGNVAQAALTPQ